MTAPKTVTVDNTANLPDLWMPAVGPVSLQAATEWAEALGALYVYWLPKTRTAFAQLPTRVSIEVAESGIWYKVGNHEPEVSDD